MNIKFNVTGEARKRLVKAISEFTGTEAEYQFMPTCAYQIGGITVDKVGTLTFDNSVDDDTIESLLENLAVNGFVGEPTVYPTQAPETPQNEELGLTVTMPRNSFDEKSLENLKRLIANKEFLIKKALKVNALPIEIDEETVSFPWFSPQGDACAVRAYTHFIQAICEMARKQKRINTGEKAVESEKYAFRCFLLRLGFVGNEYKAERKILLQNLSGSSAWKADAGDAIPSAEIVESLRQEYPVGSRVALVKMDDVEAPPIGTQGTIVGVDDKANLLVKWDNGSNLNAVYNIDFCTKIID